MAIGAIAVLVILFFNPFARAVADSLPNVILLVLMAIAVLGISFEMLDRLANIFLGALAFLFAYQYPTIKQLYTDGFIVFVLAFLLLMAAFMRPRYVE